MVDPIKDFIYNCKYRKIITLIWTIILDGEAWQFIKSLNLIYIVKDYLGSIIKPYNLVMLSVLGLTYLSDSCYLGLDRLSSSCVLILTCWLDSRDFGLD
jgi:hypothetical protein